MSQATGVDRAGYQLRREIEAAGVIDPKAVLTVIDAARVYALALAREAWRTAEATVLAVDRG